jgi:hypothetical protein
MAKIELMILEANGNNVFSPVTTVPLFRSLLMRGLIGGELPSRKQAQGHGENNGY